MSTDIRHEKVKEVLTRWNPLGDEADLIEDLNDYSTEALDILSLIVMKGKKASRAHVIRDVLNGAFGLSLTVKECEAAAAEIMEIERNYPE